MKMSLTGPWGGEGSTAAWAGNGIVHNAKAIKMTIAANLPEAFPDDIFS